MFADIVGFSRRLEQDEARNSVQTTRSINLFRSLVGDYGGVVSNVAGDGILAEFDGADQAANFATQVMSEFRDQAVWSDGNPVELRIALNVGEVVHDNGNVLGHCVNVAARVQSLATPGKVLAAKPFFQALDKSSKFTFRSLGERALRNIVEPVEIFEMEPAAAPAERAKPANRSQRISEPSQQPSVAVLQLENLSGDPANDHLCEGIAEDIIADLSRFRNLIVIARHSAFQFRRKLDPAKEIGRRLGVRYILGGTLRRGGSRLRISVELLDTETEAALWNDRFDIDIDAVLDVQDKIAAQVASRLSVQIDFAQQRQEQHAPGDIRAHGLCLRGQHLILQYTKEANAHARHLFEEAIDLAPDYARPYSGLSRTHNLDWRYSWSPDPDKSLEAAVDFAREATRRDPLDARGFAELGFAKLYQKRHEESIAEYERALNLNPNDADIIAEYADALVYYGQPDRAIKMMDHAMRLNPYHPDWYLWYLADAYNAMGRSHDVIATVLRMQNADQGRRMLAANYALLGDIDNAREQAKWVLRVQPGFTIGRWRERPPYRDKACLERFIEGMRLAGLPE